MAHEIGPIPIKEFSQNIEGFLDRVVRENTAVTIENEAGALVVIKPVRARNKRRSPMTPEQRLAFLATAGSWSEVEVDAFLKANEESRRISSRSSVKL